MFHPVVESWFRARYTEPTPVQAGAWPLIAAGEDVLIAAPTGSGKTLAAFLACLDRLVREARGGPPRGPDRDPLRLAAQGALQRRPAEPGRAARRAGRGARWRRACPRPRSAPRCAPATRPRASGGRSAPRRRTSWSPRPSRSTSCSPPSRAGAGSRDVRTVIVDEIHAVAGDKRGAHLALSLERLDELVAATGRAPAAHRPLGDAAADRDRGAAPRRRGRAPLPRRSSTPASAATSTWPSRCPATSSARSAPTSSGRRSTTASPSWSARTARRSCSSTRGAWSSAWPATSASGSARSAWPRTTAACAAQRRLDAEQRLKAGELPRGRRDRVARARHRRRARSTSSARSARRARSPPRSSASAARATRSAPRPKGRLFPLTRDELVECAALVRGGAPRRARPRSRSAHAPLDILAQQIVATVRRRGAWTRTTLFELVPRAPRRTRSSTRERLRRRSSTCWPRASRRGAGRTRRASAPRPRRRGGCAARRGARLAAITSGGAIPDNADYDVVLEPDETTVGTVDEDFAIETHGRRHLPARQHARGASAASRAARVRVEDARGAPPTIPFWLGEAPARTRELSARGRRRCGEGVADRLRRAGRARRRWLDARDAALDRARRRSSLATTSRAARAALGAVPTRETVVAERFFDEAGGMQLVIHAPFGGRINRALGPRAAQALLPQLRLRAAGRGHRRRRPALARPAAQLPARDRVRDAAPERARGAPGPGRARRRRCSARAGAGTPTRALALLRWQGGRKVPPPLQRMRADDLLAAVFPAQLACQDNAAPGPSRSPIIRWCARRSTTASSRRWTSTACAPRARPRSSAGEIQARRPARRPSRRVFATRSSTPTRTRSSTTRRSRSAARAPSRCAAGCPRPWPTTSGGSTPTRSPRSWTRRWPDLRERRRAARPAARPGRAARARRRARGPAIWMS